LPLHPRSRPARVGAAGFALAWLLATTVPAPASGQTSSGDPAPLARYVPKDNLAFYFEFEGLDANAEAWRKTAAYKILNTTTAGVMLEDLFVQLAAKVPGARLTGPEALALFKHVARSGFVFAGARSPGKGPGEKLDFAVLVLRDVFKNKETRPIVAKGLQALNAPNTKPQKVVRAGHSVISGTLPGGVYSWWVEDSRKEDLVVVTPAAGSADLILETLDGKRPNASDHPLRAELARPEGGFDPVGLGFATSAREPGGPPARLLDLRWGFQDEALMTVARISAPSPRAGSLALLDGPGFEKGALPPIPESVAGFTVLALDPKATLDKVLGLARMVKPDAEEQLNKVVEAIKARTKLRLREDILAKLGPKVAWYAMPSKAGAPAAAPAAAPGLMGAMMAGLGLDQVPKAAIVVDVADPVGFGEVLDELMAAANREFKAQAAAKAAGGGGDPGPGPGRGGRGRGSASPTFEFRPSLLGETKTYVLGVPPELSGLVPASFRPSIRVGPKQVVIAINPEVARAVLEAKSGWAPPSDLAAAFGGLPSKLKLLNVSDPRENLPAVLASLPAKLQAGINSAILLARAQAATAAGGAAPAPPAPPGPGGPGTPAASGTTVRQVDAAQLPSADAIRALLFPSVVAVEVDDAGARIVARLAFPPLPDPSQVGGFGQMITTVAKMAGLDLGGFPIPPGLAAPPPAGPGGPAAVPGPAPGPGAEPGGPRGRGRPTTPGL